MPTDTIYGLSARALDERAVEKVHQVKKRDQGKPLIVLISSLTQLDELGVEKPPARLAEKYWPGPLSLILNAPSAPRHLHRGTGTLAVRMPDYSPLRNLIEKTGPLVSTSANEQNNPPINSAEEALRQFADVLDFYINVGDLSEHQPSTLAAYKDAKLEVIRRGAVIIEE